MDNQESQSELTSFIGVMATALVRQNYTAQESKHIICAHLVKEALKLAKNNEKNVYDHYVLKPLFLAFKDILEEDFRLKQTDAYVPQIAQDLMTLDEIIKYLDKRIARIQPK